MLEVKIVSLEEQLRFKTSQCEEASRKAAEAQNALATMAGQKAMEIGTLNRRLADLEAKSHASSAFREELVGFYRSEVEIAEERSRELRKRLAELGA